MSQSPSSKRRRVSTEHSATQAADAQAKSAPTTPRRASYRSPTKASLQRSHPHLARRGNALFKHVMSSSDGVQKQQDTFAAVEATENAAPVDSAGPTTAEHADALEAQPEARDLSFFEEIALQRSDRMFSRNRPDKLPSPRRIPASQSRRREYSLSPDDNLPPTPVQLGISPQPEPPRGALSSSPRRSSSGSGRNRLGRRSQLGPTSSPLRPKSHNIQHVQALRQKLDLREQVQEVEVPAIDGAAEDVEEIEEEESEQIQEKRAILAALKKQTASLLAQSRVLEHAIGAADDFDPSHASIEPIELLKLAGPATTLHEGIGNLTPSTISAEKQLLHLNLFAPGSLTLASTTSTKLADKRVKIVHNVTMGAPAPWPKDTFSATFRVITDAEDARVEQIVYRNAERTEGISVELHSWLKDRLTNDLVRTDLAGLVWGLGNYFTAAVERTRVFCALETKYSGEERAGDDLNVHPKGESNIITAREAICLAPYLSDTHIEFNLPMPFSTITSTDSVPPKMLLTYAINLDPASNATRNTGIVLSGISDTAAAAAREVFRLRSKQLGVERAIDGVRELLAGALQQAGSGIDGEEREESVEEDEGQQADAEENPKAKGAAKGAGRGAVKRKKRKSIR